MSDDPIERLESHARRAVPAIDSGFADRLETRLRIEHSMVPTRRRLRVLLPRLGVAAGLAVAGVVGVLSLTGRDPAIPVVVDGDPELPAPAADSGDGAGAAGEFVGTAATTPGVPTATPTTTPAPTPSATPVEPVPESTIAGAAIVATPAVAPTTPPAPAVSPTPTPAPAATPIATPIATPVATATPTPIPASPVPAPTRVTPTPTPSPTAGPVSFDVTCVPRTARDAVGVVCEWVTPAGVDVTGFRVIRSRNGGEAMVVSTQRAELPRTFADRDVAAGDTVTYLVRAFSGERVVATTARVVVSVPPASGG